MTLVKDRHDSVVMGDKDDLDADREMYRLSLLGKGLLGGQALIGLEPNEILSYNMSDNKEIYFTGAQHAQKVDSSRQLSNNFGYDTGEGDYIFVPGDHLGYQYEMLDILGKGVFGQVVRCIDHKSGRVVAVKISKNRNMELEYKEALAEVAMLERLKEWDPDGSKATHSITAAFTFRSHLCVVTPCFSMNLYEFIKLHNHVGFSLVLVRRFARQLVGFLVLLQKNGVIHCDLKPENIMLCGRQKADVRVIDFGSSRRAKDKVDTHEVQTQTYRAPEVILEGDYGLQIDMWSLGCILAELWTGDMIFPGKDGDNQEQLACIVEILGLPKQILSEQHKKKEFFFFPNGQLRFTMFSGGERKPGSKKLTKALDCTNNNKSGDAAFLDFISQCLCWDPSKRLTPTDAVDHPFISKQKLKVAKAIKNPPVPRKDSSESQLFDPSRQKIQFSTTETAVSTTNAMQNSPVKASVAQERGRTVRSSVISPSVEGPKRGSSITYVNDRRKRRRAPSPAPSHSYCALDGTVKRSVVAFKKQGTGSSVFIRMNPDHEPLAICDIVAASSLKGGVDIESWRSQGLEVTKEEKVPVTNLGKFMPTMLAVSRKTSLRNRPPHNDRARTYVMGRFSGDPTRLYRLFCYSHFKQVFDKHISLFNRFYGQDYEVGSADKWIDSRLGVR